MKRCASYKVADITLQLIGDVEELLQELDAFFFNYQHVDCLYTIFKYRFSGRTVVKSGQICDSVQREVPLNHQISGCGQNAQNNKKEILVEKIQKNIC